MQRQRGWGPEWCVEVANIKGLWKSRKTNGVTFEKGKASQRSHREKHKKSTREIVGRSKSPTLGASSRKRFRKRAPPKTQGGSRGEAKKRQASPEKEVPKRRITQPEGGQKDVLGGEDSKKDWKKADAGVEAPKRTEKIQKKGAKTQR